MSLLSISLSLKYHLQWLNPPLQQLSILYSTVLFQKLFAQTALDLYLSLQQLQFIAMVITSHLI